MHSSDVTVKLSSLQFEDSLLLSFLSIFLMLSLFLNSHLISVAFRTRFVTMVTAKIKAYNRHITSNIKIHNVLNFPTEIEQLTYFLLPKINIFPK
jgi:hypothetical protein